MKRLILLITGICLLVTPAFAQAPAAKKAAKKTAQHQSQGAAVSYADGDRIQNMSARQVGNRFLFEFDLEGDTETDISVTINANGKSFSAKDLHLEGDIEKVKPGKGKKIWWNVLLDFPRGVSADMAWEVSAGGAAFTDPATGMEFVFVKGGCFDMGDTFGDGDSDEKPVHQVCVDDFYMGKYEVTQGQWQTIMGSNPSSFKNCGNDCPVESVSWNDIQDYIRKLNQKSSPFGKGGRGGFRLPTEAEWEYAAKSSGKKEKWAGTSNESELGDYAWYDKNSGSKTHQVGQKRPNGLGLYDMTGNVWEWVSDWYGDKYYGESPKNNPTGPYSGSYRVLRGGSWYNLPWVVRSANRDRYSPDDGNNRDGFRLLVPSVQ